jgi:ABC-type iron transport system FetAB ATPase subunit
MPVPTDPVSEDNPLKADLVSSPASTGGAGNVFEQAVGAYLLSQLLVGATPPVLIDCTVVEIAFQTEYRGWKTDDFLVSAQTASGATRRLAGQVKRSFTVSSIDAEFKNSIVDFWSDLHNPAIFSPEHDRFAFVVQLGTNTLIRHFGSLLDCARASSDAQDFEKRLAITGLLSSTAIRYCDEVVTIVKEAVNAEVTRSEVFPLLKVLHILSLDLATSTRQAEALMKSLLAFTATTQQRDDSASRTWNELIVLSAEGAAGAKAFRRDDLPVQMVQRHSNCGAEQPMIVALREHSSVIMRGIRSTIGRSLHLPRASLVQQVLTALEDSRIVLVSGAAGNGKSAIAKQVVTLLGRDHFTFAFRSEEFAQPHFDSTLAMANIGGRTATLATILAGQERKIVLVESLERLLEKSTRDAFIDLLALVDDDPTFRLVVTCRDYSADLVREAFLRQLETEYASVLVPPLTEAELDQVQDEDSSLAIPLASSHLRKILSNPYVLDKARSIKWSAESALPASEREFRDLFWREIVRVDHRPASGMPAKRDATFMEIALRRARALSVYASSTGLDDGALNGLISDSLVVHAEDREDLIAPAHDVLEDWAILRWLDRLYNDVGQDLALFQASLGTHPALRRSYRKWMGELLERDPSSGETFFREALSALNLSASFIDDTLVALMQSAAAGSLVSGHESGLLSNERQNLKRVIHLVRLACVTTPAWAQGNVGAFSVPQGTVWPALLGVVRRGWSNVDSESCLLVLGFVEDWARGISLDEPYPPGADDAAVIAYALIGAFDDYSHNDELKRTVQIIAKIPNVNASRYAELLLSSRQKGRDRSHVAEELQEMLFCGPFYESLPTARDLSSPLISGLRNHLVCTDDDLEEELEWPSSIDTELYFGLRGSVSHNYFPESAHRTPMFSLLRQHPRAALDFLIELFSHVADWYAHPRISNPLEPAFEVTIKLPNGSAKTHWCNSRLWQLYRGTSVGPYVLQSYLMALERWLRELAKHQPDLLDPILIELLSKTDNASIAGVVAGVAIAFPFQAGQALLSLLSSREYVALDRQRMVADFSPPSQVLQGMMGNRDAEQQFFNSERMEADKWPSRKSDLEAAVRNLQLTHFVGRVQSRLDELRAALGPLETQDDDDRLWRLALHRMDLREYQVADEAIIPEQSRREGFVLMEAKDPDPDIKELLARTTPQIEEQQQRMVLLMWAHKAFRRELTDPESAAWRERLAQAREQQANEEMEPLRQLGAGGSDIMAAFCARDHWDELCGEERDWCVVRVANCIKLQANNWNHVARIQRYDMAPDRSCAYAAVILPTKSVTQEQRAVVDELLPLALTHPVGEVRWYATHAVTQLWTIEPDLAMLCVFAIVMEARVIVDLQMREARKVYDERRSYEDMASEAANKVRALFWQPGVLQEGAYDQLSLDEWHGTEAQNRILTILGKAPEQPLARKAFGRAAEELVKSWKSKHDHDSRRRRNIEADISLANLIEQFVLRAPLETAINILTPIVDAVDRHPDEVHNIVLGILHMEDREPHPPQFWEIWKLFADRAKRAPWIGRIDSRHSSGAEMIHALFLGTLWKDTTRHWRSLEGHAQNIHNLFEILAPSSCAMEAYVRFLYHIGEQSLPDAFIRIYQKSEADDPKKLFRNSNTRYRLEVLLQRYVYSKPLLLKERAALRVAVLALLDALIDLGSSAAFRMRDDFVTPISA